MSDQPAHQTKKIHNLTVTIDRELCIGAGTCTALAPHAFLVDAEGKVLFGETPEKDTVDAITQAAQGCPVLAIRVANETGQQIAPK